MLGDSRLGPQTREILQEAGLVVSFVTLFEIELKLKTRKLRLPGPVSEFVERFGLEIYYPQADELDRIINPALVHSDPFDCAMVGLGQLKNWPVMTSDKKLLGIAGNLVELIDSRK